MAGPEHQRAVTEKFLTIISAKTGIPDPVEYAKSLYLGNEFTISQVADDLGVSSGTAYRLLGMGGVPTRDANIQRVILQDPIVEARRKHGVENSRDDISEKSRQRSHGDKRQRQEALLGEYPEGALQLLYNSFHNTKAVAAYLSNSFEMHVSRHTIGNWAKEMNVEQERKDPVEKSAEEKLTKKQRVLGESPKTTLGNLMDRYSSDSAIAYHLAQTYGVRLKGATVGKWRKDEGLERTKKTTQKRREKSSKTAFVGTGIDVDSIERGNKPTPAIEHVIVDFSPPDKPIKQDTRPVVIVDGEEGRLKEITKIGGVEAAIVITSNNRFRIVPLEKLSYKDKTQ